MDPKGCAESVSVGREGGTGHGCQPGTGASMALGLAGAGADVALVGRDLTTLEPVAREIERDLPRQALAIALDVANLDSVPPAVDAVMTRFGRIDILINNAGINIRKPTLDYSPEEWDAGPRHQPEGDFFLTQQVGRRWSGPVGDKRS